MKTDIQEIYKGFNKIELTDSEKNSLRVARIKDPFDKYEIPENDLFLILKVFKHRRKLSLKKNNQKLDDLSNILNFLSTSKTNKITFESYNNKIEITHPEIIAMITQTLKRSGMIGLFLDPLPGGNRVKIPQAKQRAPQPETSDLRHKIDIVDKYLSEIMESPGERKYLIGTLISIVRKEWKRTDAKITDRKYFSNRIAALYR